MHLENIVSHPDRSSVGAGSHQTGQQHVPDSRFVIRAIVSLLCSVSFDLGLAMVIPLHPRRGCGHEAGGDDSNAEFMVTLAASRSRSRGVGSPMQPRPHRGRDGRLRRRRRGWKL